MHLPTLNKEEQNIVIYLLLNQYQYFTPINYSFQISNFNDLACQISQVTTIATFGLGMWEFQYHLKKRWAHTNQAIQELLDAHNESKRLNNVDYN